MQTLCLLLGEGQTNRLWQSRVGPMAPLGWASPVGGTVVAASHGSSMVFGLSSARDGAGDHLTFKKERRMISNGH